MTDDQNAAGAESAPPAGGEQNQPASSGSIAGGAGSSEGGEQQVKSEFPENWRSVLAGDDEATLKFLSSHNTPQDLAKASLRLRQELSKRPAARPGEGASEEQLAEWRSSQGIPADPKGYKEAITLPDHFDADRDGAMLDSFLSTAHAVDMPSEQAKQFADWWFDGQERAAQEFSERVRENQQKARHDLSEKWGGAKNFDATIMAVQRLGSERIGDEARDDLFGSLIVDASGNPIGKLGDHPAFLELIASAARMEFGEDLPMLDGELTDDGLEQAHSDLLAKYDKSMSDSTVRWSDTDEEKLQKLSVEMNRRQRRAGAMSG